MGKRRNIVLVGFMGTGKTAVGRRVARRLRMQFVDIDSEIVREAGVSIPEIFESESESGFRTREREVVMGLSGRSGQVLSTGGGIVLDQANVDALARNGTLVCLDASIDTILERVGRNRTRPLLQGPDRRRRVEEMMEARAPYYARIPLHVATDGRSPDEVAREVIDCVQSAGGGSGAG